MACKHRIGIFLWIALSQFVFAIVNWDDMRPEFIGWYEFWTVDTAGVRNFALVIAAMFAGIVGLPLAVMRTKASHRQSLAAENQTNINEKRHDTERFSRAVEQLGSEQMAVRLGAIYALEHIAKQSPDDYHWPIMETLTAFVRKGNPEQDAGTSPVVKNSESGVNTASDIENNHNEDKAKESSYQTPVGADISAVMAVLARRDVKNDPKGRYLDLTGAYLVGLDFTNVEPRNLNKARLSGANLAHAILYGVHLRNALLDGANLRVAFLMAANLEGADLEETDLWEADLEETVVMVSQLIKAVNPLDANLDDDVREELEKLLIMKDHK